MTKTKRKQVKNSTVLSQIEQNESRKSLVLNSIVDLEKFWTVHWQGWFECLRKKHDKLMGLRVVAKSLDEFYQQSLHSAQKSSSTVTDTKPSFFRVNFAGQKQLTLRRDRFVGPHANRSLLSVLFDARWEAVLPKDKDGRVYLDIHYEWIKPLLDAYLTEESIVLDAQNNLFWCPQEAQNFWHAPWILLRCNSTSLHSQLTAFGDDVLEKVLKICCPTASRGLFVSDHSQNTLILSDNYKNLFCVHNNFLHVIQLANASLDVSHFNPVSRFNRSTYQHYGYGDQFFQQQATALNLFDLAGNQLTLPQTWIEMGITSPVSIVTSCGFNQMKPQQTSSAMTFFEENESEISLPVSQISNTSPSAFKSELSSFTENMSTTLDEIEKQIAQFDKILKPKLAQAVFIECFVVHNNLHKFVRTETGKQTDYFPMGTENNIEKFINKDADVVKLIRESYARIAAMGAPSKQRQQSDNIVCFNVDGESVCTLRSSIVSVLPESQLAIRVSGEWTEQDNTLDIEGRIVVDFPLCVFKPLLDYIRIAGMLGVEFVKKEIYVTNNRMVTVAKEMLDYFVIEGLSVAVNVPQILQI